MSGRRRFQPWLLTLTCALMGASAWADDPLARDGWSTWRVAAVDPASDWCCYDWNAGHGTRTACDLESERQGFSVSERSGGQAGELQLWLRVHQGKADRLVALSSDCPIKENVVWQDLGRVDETTSLDWLARGVSRSESLQHRYLSAVAAHEGPRSAELLRMVAESDPDPERRREAVFWMGQLRVDETRDTLLSLMRSDADPQLRDHAIFSFAQSPADDRMDVLITLIEDQGESLEGRKQALFWLAQAEDGTGVAYIQELLLGQR